MTNSSQNSTFLSSIQYLWGYRRGIILLTITVTFLTTVISFLLPKKYDASVLFMISEPKVELSDRYVEPVKIRNYSQLITCNTVLFKTIKAVQSKLKKAPSHFNRQVLTKMVDVTIKRDSHLVSLKVRALAPDDASLIANTIARVFSNHIKTISERSAKNIQKLISQQIDETKTRLNNVDEQLRTFFKENRIIDLNIERELNLNKIDKFTKNYAEKMSMLEGLKASLTSLQSSLKGEPQFLIIESYLGKKPLLKEQLQKNTKHRRVKNSQIVTESIVNETYQKTNQKIAENLAKYASLTQELLSLSKEIDKLQKKVSRYPDLELQYRKLSIQSEMYKNILKDLNKQFDEAKLLVASKSGDLEIVDSAISPLLPSSPKKLQLIIFSMFITFTFSLFAILLFRMINTSIDKDTHE